MKNEILNKLLKVSDKKYQKFSSALCPGTQNIIGVKIPLVRKIAKEIFKENKSEVYLALKPEYFEEIMIQAILIGYLKDDITRILREVKMFLPKIDNWAVCDIFCGGLKITQKYRKEIWNFIKKYSKSKNEFELRFAIVIMLCYFLTDDYIYDVLKEIDKIKNDGYYVKMAAAWAISAAYIKYPDITLQYLKNNSLDTFTFNKALQKITESYRVSPENKKIIKRMRKC